MWVNAVSISYVVNSVIIYNPASFVLYKHEYALETVLLDSPLLYTLLTDNDKSPRFMSFPAYLNSRGQNGRRIQLDISTRYTDMHFIINCLGKTSMQTPKA